MYELERDRKDDSTAGIGRLEQIKTLGGSSEEPGRGGRLPRTAPSIPLTPSGPEKTSQDPTDPAAPARPPLQTQTSPQKQIFATMGWSEPCHCRPSASCVRAWLVSLTKARKSDTTMLSLPDDAVRLFRGMGENNPQR